jgi:hypothetical protein
VAAGILAGVLAAPWVAGITVVSAEPSDWRGRPAIEFTDPRVERTGTLRVVRFGSDPRQTIDDQGSLIGWGRAAIDGTVKPNHEPVPFEETLEIIEKSEASSLSTKK